MALRNLVVQCLSAEEQSAAAEILRRHGPVTTSGMYVRGFGEQADVDALEAKGLLVEQLPATPELSWLDPATQNEQAAGALLAAAADEPERSSPIQEAAGGANPVYIVQLKGPMRDDWKRALDDLDVRLGPHVPDFAYKVELTDEQRSLVEDLSFVVRVVEYSATHTLRRLTAVQELQRPLGEETIRAASTPAPEATAYAAQAGELVTYEVRCHDPASIPVVAAAVEEDPRTCQVVVGRRRIRFMCTPGSPVVGELANLPQVSSVDLFQFPELANIFVRKAIGIDPPEAAALPWDGTGVIVAVADSGVDAEHPDLQQRIKKVIERVPPEAPGDPNGHGTHVCGTIAGDGTASSGQILGVAPGAQLIVQGLRDRDGLLSGLPINLGTLFEEAYAEGARIHTNSWGVLAGGLYTLDAYEVDEFIYTHPDCLVIFAAGNRGAQPPELDDLGRIGFNSLQSPASAKNVLTVGACCSPRHDGPFQGKTWRQYPNGPQKPKVADEPICGDPTYVAAFSSRGPTDDERVKPDLLAPGSVVLSTRSQACDPRYPYAQDRRYHFLTGTSMAAPAVAGAAAIVRQYYLQERRHQPSAALLKATLVNGAVWIDRETVVDAVGQPNFHQGFGRLDLRRTLPVPGDPSRLALGFADVSRDSDEALNKSIAERAAWKRTVHVGAGLPLQVTLAWTERPDHGLQQDLDLVVLTPSGKRLPGNPSLARGPWAKTDHRNNLEQVIVDDPEPGEYRLQVLAYNTLYEDQGFSLVVAGRLMSDLLP
jgi:serine protease AprX